MKQKFLVTTPTCPVCKVVEEELTRMGRLDEFTIIDASTPEGLKQAREMGVTAVPECVLVEEENGNKTSKVCTKDDWKEILGK